MIEAIDDINIDIEDIQLVIDKLVKGFL